jgi:hypothetical protein
MSNEVAIQSDWQTMKDQATALVKSGFLPAQINTPEKAMAIALAGKEIGIGLMESLRSIHVIQGKPTISPQLMLALANRTKQLEDLTIDARDEVCYVTITRKGRKPHMEMFGIKEARALGLLEKDNYKKQQRTMFKWRALAANLRVTFPDVMLGLYTPEEVGAEVIVGESEEMEVVNEPNGSENMMPKTTVTSNESGIVVKKDYMKMDKFIGSRQQYELFRLIKMNFVDMNEFKTYIKEKYGVTESANIKAKDYDAIAAWVEAKGESK